MQVLCMHDLTKQRTRIFMVPLHNFEKTGSRSFVRLDVNLEIVTLIGALYSISWYEAHCCPWYDQTMAGAGFNQHIDP